MHHKISGGWRHGFGAEKYFKKFVESVGKKKLLTRINQEMVKYSIGKAYNIIFITMNQMISILILSDLLICLDAAAVRAVYYNKLYCLQ